MWETGVKMLGLLCLASQAKPCWPTGQVSRYLNLVPGFDLLNHHQPGQILILSHPQVIGRCHSWGRERRVCSGGAGSMSLLLSQSRGSEWWQDEKIPKTLNLDGGSSVVATALVQSGCCNKTSQSEWLTNNRNLILTVLEAGISRSECKHSWVTVFFWVTNFSSYFYITEGAQELCGVSFIRALNLSLKAPPSWFKHVPKPHLLVPSHWH